MANSFTNDYLSKRKQRLGAAYAAPKTDDEEKKIRATSNSGASEFTRGYIESRVNSAPPVLSATDRAKLDMQAANRAAARNATTTKPVTNNMPRRSKEEIETELKTARKTHEKAATEYVKNVNNLLRKDSRDQIDELMKAMEESRTAVELLEKELKYTTTTHDDDFFGQFGANYDAGRLAQDTNAAYNAYLTNPTEESKARADAMAMLEQQFQINNQAALDDEGAVLPWITQSAAGYLPQLVDQTVATVGGGAAGALGGAGVGSVIPVVGTGAGAVWGARAGAVAASGVYSYGQMRGAAYRELINAGVDEETARAAANDEAVISALIEMADTGVDIATLGTGKLLSLLGKGGMKAATKGAASSATKKLLKGLAGYGLNIAGEAVEEGLQQSVSIANQDRDGTGILNLAGGAANTLWDAATGEDMAARDEILEASGEGAKIAAMFGGMTRAATGIANTALEARTGREMQAMGGDETVQAMIETGLESDKNTESYQLATQMQQKLNSGKALTNVEIGRLQQANVKAIEAEGAQSASDPLMDLARETVAERETSRQAQTVAATEGNSRSSVPYNVLSMENPVRKARDNAIKNTGYGENGMKAFTEALDSSGESVDQVRAKFQTAYELGRFDTPREKVELVTDLQKIAYNAGRLDHIADLGKKVNTTTAGAESGFDSTGAPSFVTSTQTRIVDDLAKALGSKVVIGKSRGNAHISGSGAVVIADDFQTKVGGNDVSIVYHAAHEIGMHRLMQLAPTEGRAFMNAMYNYMSEGRPQTAATLIEEKQSAYAEQRVSLTTDKAAEEVVANNILSLYENEEAFGNAVRRIAEGNDHEAKRGLKKFREILGDIVKKLRDVISKLTGKEKAEAQHALSEVEHLREMYENALAAAVQKNKELTAEKNATQTSDVEYQMTADGLKYSLKMSFAEQVEAALNRELDRNTAVYVMNTPEMLQALGMKEYPMLITQRHIRDINHEKSPKNTHWHGLSEDIIKKMPDMIANPVMLLESTTAGDVVVVSSVLDSDNFPVIISIHPDGNGHYNRAEIASNFVTSMYGRRGFGAFMETAIEKDRVLYVNKKRTRSLYSRVRLQLPKSLDRDGFIKDSIAPQEDVVNGETQFSLKDSTGRTLSPGQQEYFKDSKVRDENGNLKVMYHGTPNGDFTVFKDGSYFTDSKEYADRYQSPSASSISTGKKATAPKTFAVYLDIKKPFDITDPEAWDIYINEYIKGGNAMGINPYLSDAEYRKIKTVDWTEGEDLRDFLIDNGYDYDGLVLDEGADGGYGDEVAYRGQSYVVFSPEQVKDIDNLNPTDDPDVRFSLKETDGIGLSYDENTESVNPSQFSLKTWTQSEYVTAREKAAKEMAKALGITEKKALAYIDSVNSIAKTIADDRVRLDYEASPGRSSFVKNAEYGGSIDFSTICKKRRLFTGTFEAIQEALPNTALTAEEILDIRSRMDKKGYEVSCGLCYVEGSRANMGQFTKQFLERYKATNPAYVPNMAEMNTATGQEKIRREHPEVYEAYEYFMNHYGRLDPSDKALFASQQKPKMYQMSTEYQGEILQKFKKGSNVEDKNANGGLRLQSFSDFEIIHLIDTMQVIMDMAHVGLAGQAYTKVPDFAWALGDTGLKINLSLIAKGIDRNGKLILDEKEGMSEANAMALRDRYSENVGTILVVFTDNQLKAAMADDRIDFIIPFHRSQWKTDQYEIMGLPANAKDYTNWQNEAYIEPVYNAKGKKQRPDNYMPNTYWDFTKSGKENAETYLRMCAENNRRPKFHFLLKDNQNGSYSLQPDGSTDGYWKLLIDFKMYDNDGNGVPQRPVRPDFNMEEAQRMLEDYTGGHSKFPAAEDVVAEFVEEYKSSHEGVEFSLKEQNDLLKENAKLKEVNEGLRDQLKTTTFAQVDKKSLDKFTKALLKDYQSGADINEIRDALNGVYTYMANGEDGNGPAWNDLQERAYNVAVSILENASTVNDEMYQAYKGLRDRLRNYPISINKEYDNDIQGYESINDFRKANFGRIKITGDGTPVDIVYADLANTYPEFFDESEYTTQADQLTHIADVLDSLQPYEVNPYSSDMRRAATWLASDIIERFYELPQAKPTFADKQAAKLTKQVIKDAKKLENLREKKNEHIRDLIQKNREKVKATTQREREKRVEAVKEIKDHYKAKEQKASESRKARELRAKIMRHAQDMSKKLLKPTDKQHIPQKLQGAVAKLLESINLESKYTVDPETGKRLSNGEGDPNQRTKAFAEIRKLYAEMASELVIDPDLLGEDGLLSDVAELADKRIADMTSEELETVYRTLRAVEASVSSANKAFAESRWASIEDAAESLREENKNKRQVTEYAGPLGWGQKLTGLDMMTPSAFFHRLGESGDAIFRMMRDAQDKHIKLMKSVEDFTHKELENVPVKKWEKELHTVKLGGENVQLTTAQIMELYVLTKRKQAQDHIFMGGILPEAVANKGIKKITRAEPVRGIDIGEVSKAVNLLTAEQKKVADKLQQFASTELSRWGNEAAMQVYNYEKFNEKVYWPIRSNRQEISSTVEKDTQVTSVAGRGFSKNTKPNANTSVKIGSIFDTFATHSGEMATYAAWLATAEDINRIRNYTFLGEEGGRVGTVKGIIERVHGSRGTQYLQKLLSDIANGVGAGRGNETRMDQIVGNYKASAIGANLRVIIQQPTALLRAMDMIDPHYLASVKNPLSGWEKAKKYAPIAQWKDWGYFDINTGRQMKDVLFDTDSTLEKVKQFTMAGAGLADSFSWGALWNAVENEVKANRENLKPGSEDFYKAVAARFTEIVDHTQVVDGILQRSQIMRSADGLTKMATSFMGEPTKQYNMVMSALYDFRYTEGKARTASRKRFARTAFALVLAGVANAAAQSIIDAVRDDDDEKEYWEKWLTAFFGLEGDEETTGEKIKAAAFGSNLMNIFNPAGYIPYAKDIVSIFQGYDVSRMDMESIEKTISSWNNLWKAINGEGNYTIHGASINFIAEAARLFGVPVANLKREIVSFTTMIAQGTDSFLMQYHMEKFFTNPVNSSKGVLDILYNAYTTDKEQFNVLYKRMLKDDELKKDDQTTADVIAGKLKDKVVDDLYELYKTDSAAYEEMYNDLIRRDFLKTGVKTDDPETDTFKSTADHIATAMETRMKKDQGVDKVGELEKRYFGPEQQREYDRKLQEIQSSGVWKSANEEQRDKLEDNLRGIVNETDSKMLETIAEGAEYGLDDTEYLLYKLALETVDQANENGNLGTYSDIEKAAAISSLNLGDGETAFLWNTDQALEAFGYGIDMDKYITFKSEIGSIKADKDWNGKTISGSRKKKIISYLNSLGVSYKDYLYLLGTEYDMSKNRDYLSYFGE